METRNLERSTGGHREQQADVERQRWETPPYKPGPPAGLREGLARALQAGGPEHRPRGQRPAERGGRVVKAPQADPRPCGAARERRPKGRDRSRHRCRPSAGRSATGAHGLGGPEVAGSIGQPAMRVRTAEAPPREYILMFADELAKWLQLSAMPTSLHFAVRVNINKFLSCFRA